MLYPVKRLVVISTSTAHRAFTGPWVGYRKHAISAGGRTMAERDPYFLGHSVVEQQRLQQQARDLAEESRRFFEQIAIPTGAHVVEIGCGPQGCLGLLADRVGPTGAVVGVEMSK